MAGLFGLFDFTKEGPGVRKDEPDKGPVHGTMEILFRRLWELIKLNLMMIVFNLPALLIAYFASLYLLPSLFPGLSIETFTQSLGEQGLSATAGQSLEVVAVSQLALLNLVAAVALVGSLLFVVGPFQAGFAYVLRSYIRDEHVFLWSDFIERAKENLRQSLIASVIGAVVTVLLVINYSFYRTQLAALPSQVGFILQVLILMLGLIWIAMQHYIYPMIVTFKLSLPQIYRNSLLFVLLRLPYNLLNLLIISLFTLIIPSVLIFWGSGATMLAAMIWYLLFALSFPQFISMAITWRGMDRYLIKASEQVESENKMT